MNIRHQWNQSLRPRAAMNQHSIADRAVIPGRRQVVVRDVQELFAIIL